MSIVELHQFFLDELFLIFAAICETENDVHKKSFIRLLYLVVYPTNLAPLKLIRIDQPHWPT